MKIKELLNTPDKWHKGHYAIDKNGNIVDSCDPIRDPNQEFQCYCLLGAANRCYANDKIERHRVIDKMIDYIYQQNKGDITYFDVPAFNDSHKTTFEDVRRMLETLDI